MSLCILTSTVLSPVGNLGQGWIAERVSPTAPIRIAASSGAAPQPVERP
jgi:hypothetical protein